MAKNSKIDNRRDLAAEVERLREYEAIYHAITREWDKTNQRRCELIEKSITGELTTDEEAEYDRLQDLCDLVFRAQEPHQAAREDVNSLFMETVSKSFEEVARLTAALHANRCHPDYVYLIKHIGDKDCELLADLGLFEWERNPEYVAAPGDECWRKRKATT